MKILHIDIETAPHLAHCWGLFKENISIKQLIDASYTMCYAAKFHRKGKMMFDSIHHNSPEEMVKGVWNLLDQSDAVCHWNGERFDIPTLNKEFLFYGFGPPSPYHQIDLMKTARKKFKFASNKLDYVARALGVEGKVNHTGHELWLKCMYDNDPKAWRLMQKYNKQDVWILEEIYDKILPWIGNHPNHALYLDTDRPVCTNCGSEHVQKRGTMKSKTQTYTRFCCTQCGTWMRSRQNSTPNKEHVLTQV